jgi:TusA-related sulfurtransferase
MTGTQGLDDAEQTIGEEWIRVKVEKNFQRLAGICQPEVRSRLMTPKRFDTFEIMSNLAQKVEGWFHEGSSFQKEQTRITRVGEKLAIFYRLSFEKNGEPITAELQLFCTLRDGLIDQVNLLCSGFQPRPAQVEMPIGHPANSTSAVQPPNTQSAMRADAFLKLETNHGQGSTSALFTPSIKHKLGEMNSGQVLEAHLDDPSAKEYIEAWCRLSGNSLVKLEPGVGQEMHFFLMKK